MYRKDMHIHFVGIGGIGMSGIAEVLKKRGYTVSGCDASTRSTQLDHLADIGCSISVGHSPDHVETADVVVYSTMVSQKNDEIQRALARKIPVIPRALMLAELMRTKYSVAISGAHGKTTTTSMIAHILIEAQLDPTVLVGGVLKNISTHAHHGRGDIIVAEACESDRSFLLLNPTMAVVTNIDLEHLETYTDINDIKQTFKNFLARIPFYGCAVVCSDNEHVRSILPLPHVRTITYGFNEKAEIKGTITDSTSFGTTFNVTLQKPDQEAVELGSISLPIPGNHNVLNALASIALAREHNVPFDVIAMALAEFKGVERRFEHKGIWNGVQVFDDYGHHPTEIDVTLTTAESKTKNKVHVLFEPHRFSRTYKLFDEFVEVLSKHTIESLFVLDIYGAFETPIPGLNSTLLVDAIRKKCPNLAIYYTPSYQDALTAVMREKEKFCEGDFLMTIGAGRVYRVGEALALNKEVLD